MRKMLQTKAGATFCMDCREFTYAVRKDVVEIIYKVKPGVYMVVNFARVDATRGMLFVSWGRFWDRITNERLQLPRVEKCCPVLYEVLTGGDKDGIMEMEFGMSAEVADHGFGLEVQGNADDGHHQNDHDINDADLAEETAVLINDLHNY